MASASITCRTTATPSRTLVKNRKDYERIQIRRNPFDVREIFLLHPVRNEWIAVPTRHIGFPDAAIRELAGAKREALRRKREPTPETLARIIEEQRRHIEESQRKTKTAQRDATRRKHHERIRKEAGHCGRSRSRIDCLRQCSSFKAQSGQDASAPDRSGTFGRFAVADVVHRDGRR